MRTRSGAVWRRRLEAFKAGTGVYSGDPRQARKRQDAQLRRWRLAVEDAEELEPYVGAERAWKLAARYHRVGE